MIWPGRLPAIRTFPSAMPKNLVKYYWNANRSKEGYDKELAAILEITRTKDCQEGIRSFMEKRDPDYRGPFYENWPFESGNGS